MNRGSTGYCQRCSRRLAGFNEAPIHESGKYRSMCSVMRVKTSFNEAPIHESGKSIGDQPIQGQPHRFNEAPIHESGKSQSWIPA